VQAALAHWLDEPGQRGKRAALDQDREQHVLDYIRQNAEQDTSVTKTEIVDHSTPEFRIKFPRGWFNSFVLHDLHEGFQTKRAQEEEQRLQVVRAFLERTIRDLHDYL
jgi:phage-related minor tail protein